MKELRAIFLNRIDYDFEREFWHRLTSKGDKDCGRSTIKHYKEMYNIFGGSDKFTKEETEKIWKGIDRINKLLIEARETPEPNIDFI